MTSQKVQKKADITRNLILDKALELFLERGFEQTTMRAIAEEAGMSLGASYYHFRSKEDLVMAFYERIAFDARHRNIEQMGKSRDFKKRFTAVLEYKHTQLSPYRCLVSVLARQAGQFNHPLSPFSRYTRHLRNDAIGLIEDAVEGSTLKVSKILRPHIAKMLWLYQMGIILFWANDTSRNQTKTKDLISLSLNLIVRLLQFSSLPFMNPVNSSAVKIVRLIESAGKP